MVDVSKVEGRQARSTKLDELTWPEVRAAIDAGRTTVIFAAGSTEQHGPHLPLQTDTLLGTWLVEAIVERVPGAFQGPTVSLGCSEHHMAFAGTITLSKETFKAVVREYAESLAAHGFEHIFVVPTHGGNFAPLRELADELGGRAGNARFTTFTDLFGYIDVSRRIGAEEGITPEVAGAHAGEGETSRVLAARGDLVQFEHACEGYVGEFSDVQAKNLFANGMTALTSNGILGDARPATAERGLRYRDGGADYLAAMIREHLPE